ncbi:hypothetical protein HRbin29_02229 [bacterium HR29]|jgi:hypothetical protein|nr:hypothetical protein HRbin29_02229 [bacterium HR29]
MECVKCGAHLPPEARYCWRCGYRAARAPADEPTTALEPPEPAPAPGGGLRWAPPASEPEAAAPETSSAKRAWPTPVPAAAGGRWQYASAHGLATAIRVLAAFVVLGFALDALLGFALVVNPRSTTYDTLGIGTLIGFLAVLPMAVLFLVWTRRITGNLEVFGTERSWGTGWAIGAWFIPFGSWILPMFVINQAYKATDPGVAPPVGSQWRSRPSSALYWTWWVSWVLGNALSSVPLSVYQETAARSEDELVTVGWAFFLCYSILAAAAVLGAVVVHHLTNRQDAYARRWFQLPV